ncbi:hypothetical protein D3C87_1474060 [compost metagenome]
MERGLKDIFNIGTVIDLAKANKLNEEKEYNIISYSIHNERKGRGIKQILTGQEIKRKVRLENNNLKYGNPIERQFEYYGLYKVGQEFRPS